MKKIVLLALVLVVLSLALISKLPTSVEAHPANIIVPDDYEKIQWAIGNASDGDTIFVSADTYYENVIANKRVSLIGENKYNTIIDGNLTGNVIEITASNVNITGFTIQNSGSYKYGIYVASSGNNISYNIITNNGDGIVLENAHGNIVSGNIVSSNNGDGTSLFGSSGNIVSGNNVSNNHKGIQLLSSGNNTLFNNNMTGNTFNFDLWGDTDSEFDNSVDVSNTVDGKPVYYLKGVTNTVYDAQTNASTVYLINCNNITLKHLTLTKNYEGVFFWKTSNSKIENVTASNNIDGIRMYYSSNNVVCDNTVSNNSFGIRLFYSSGNIVSGNTVSSNNLEGIFFSRSSNNAISGNDASSNNQGIALSHSSDNNIVSGNTVSSNNWGGIYLYDSCGNTFSSNNASNNGIGIQLDYSSNNVVFHNNFMNNTQQVHISPSGYANFWDDGYPSGGNYWSNYTGVDLYSGQYQNEVGSDGIGDTSHDIDVDNQDGYPLMGPISFFNACTWDETTYYVHTLSNSTVSNFYFSRDNKLVSLNVTGPDGTVGFCRVTIPRKLMWCDALEEWNITINGNPPTYLKAMDDADNTYLYFTYNHTVHNVKITSIYAIPEFPTWTSMLLILILLTVALAIHKRRLLKTPIH